MNFQNGIGRSIDFMRDDLAHEVPYTTVNDFTSACP